MNTTELISALKIKGSFPTSDNLFSTSDYLVLFNMQMELEIFPLMLTLSEEYFVLSKDFTISVGTLYRVPSRAIGAKFRDIQYIDSGSNVIHLDRLFEEDRDTNPRGFYLSKNSIELSNDLIGNTLRVKYFGRPNKLVATTEAGQITSIDSTTQVTVSALPTTMTTSVLCDFVQNKSPFDLLDYDAAITGVSGSSVSFASLPSGLAVGDWVCLAEESPVPMFPKELHPVLVQSALVAALSAKKDKALTYEAELLERNKKDAIKMLDPRVENNSVKFRSGRLLNYITS